MKRTFHLLGQAVPLVLYGPLLLRWGFGCSSTSVLCTISTWRVSIQSLQANDLNCSIRAGYGDHFLSSMFLSSYASPNFVHFHTTW